MKTSFMERQMNQMSNLWEKTFDELDSLPQPDEFGMCKINYQELRRLIQLRSRLSYCNGFFYGVSCSTHRERIKNEITFEI